DQLRANKLRSALTVLGVVIGIATVMAMASIVAGFREQIVNTLEVVGPTTFRVLRFFSTTGVNPDAVPREVRIRPKLIPQEAEAIARLPEIHYAAIWTQLFERFEDRKSTRLNFQSRSDLVCRLLLEKKNIICRVTTRLMTGRSCGRMTSHSRCQRLAPSTSAAS